jgi:uncharacterized membrane protein
VAPPSIRRPRLALPFRPGSEAIAKNQGMNTSWGRRLGWLVLGIVIVVIVGAVAYWFGANSSGRVMGPFMMRPYGGWFGFNGVGDFGGFGLLWAVAIGFLFVLLLAALLAPGRGSVRPSDGGSGDLERLKQLADMHDRGALTDEEYAAAKRRLLGL